jgi:hypothetical protein
MHPPPLNSGKCNLEYDKHADGKELQQALSALVTYIILAAIRLHRSRVLANPLQGVVVKYVLRLKFVGQLKG